MAEINYLVDIDLNKNQLSNFVVQHIGSDPSAYEGGLFYHSGSNVLKFHNGTAWISLSSATGDITGVTAGDGLSGGGNSGGVTLAVGEGAGITVNSGDVAVTAANTNITSLTNAALTLGRDTHNLIDFGTDNQIKFTVSTNQAITFKASGEIEATKFDGALEGNADTATALASAVNIGGVSFDGSGSINLPGVNSAGNQNTSGTAAIATTVTITDNENTDEDNPIVFVAGGDVDGGNLGLETDGTAHYNPSTGKITATAFAGALTGNVTGNVTGNTSGSAGTVTSIGNLTGDVTSSNRTTTIASAAVHHAMLHDDIISGQGDLGANLASTDEFLVSDVSDSGTVKRMDASRLTTFLQSSLTFTTNTDADVSVANLKTRLAGGFGSNAVTIGDSNDVVTIGNDLTVTGDLLVSGDTVTVNTATLSVEDPMIKLASGNNAADAVDTGFYNKYNEESTVKYAGLFRDVSADGNAFTFFDGLQAEPGTTVNTGGTGYDHADLIAGSIKAQDGFVGSLTGNVTGNASGSAGTVTSIGNLTGDVTSSNRATTIAADAVTYAKMQNVSATNVVLGRDSSGAGIVEEISASSLRTMINVENGATADQSKSDIDGLAITTVGTLDTGNATAIVSAASTSAAGKVELATTAEALAGSDSARAVTPAGLAARSFKATIGDGSDNDIAVTHNLGTRDVIVQLYDASSYDTVIAEVVRTDANNVTINTNSGSSIASNDVIVLITKID
jgi:hypothetical protein